MQNIDTITLVLIAVTGLVSYKGFTDYSFIEKYKFSTSGIARGEYYRLVSSGFLHVDWQHFIFNMLSLYFFAGVIISRLGTVGFLLLYFLAMVVGNLLSYFLHKKEPYYSAVGASGAVTGVIYGAILLAPSMTILVFVIPMPALVFGVGYLLYSIYGMKTRTDNIGHSAHFGGAIAGYAFILFLKPYLLEKETFTVLALALPIALLFWLVYKKKI